METIYLIFLIIGGLGLISSLIFGDFDHGDLSNDIGHDFGHDAGDADSPKLFSLRIIFAFLMAFGIGGGSMFISDKSVGSQIIVGLLSGVFAAGITFYIMKILYSFQGHSNIDANDFIGKQASVTIETTNSGSCQIKIDTGGGDQLFMAQEKNGGRVKQNEIVKVVGRIGNVIVIEKLKNNK